MTRSLANDELRSRLAAAALRTIHERYSFAVRMKKIVAIYNALLADDHQSPAE
jgi:hypothetical protein